jgi:phage shock protein A
LVRKLTGGYGVHRFVFQPSNFLILGILFGAQIGANLGAKGATDRARKEEMDRLGVTQEMLDTAEECGLALQQSMEGLKATQSSLDTHQSLARRLDRDATELYEKAKEAMASGNEEAARTALLRRNENQEKFKKVLKLCAEEKKRFEMMERNVGAIEQRALEVESLLQRTIGAKARQASSFADLSLSVEDPLLKKFRDLGID